MSRPRKSCSLQLKLPAKKSSEDMKYVAVLQLIKYFQQLKRPGRVPQNVVTFFVCFCNSTVALCSTTAVSNQEDEQGNLENFAQTTVAVTAETFTKIATLRTLTKRATDLERATFRRPQ